MITEKDIKQIAKLLERNHPNALKIKVWRKDLPNSLNSDMEKIEIEVLDK